MSCDAEVRGGENINDFLFVCADFCCDTLNRFDWERKKSGYGYLQRRCDLSICACVSRNSRLICLSAFHFLLLYRQFDKFATRPAALPHAARNLPPMISFCLRRSDYFLVIERAAGGRAAGENKRKE